jgi:PAS domain S-box-containing protein
LIDELKKSKDNYAALSDTISEVIIRIDENFNIVYANYAVKQVMGYDRDELLNESFKKLFPVSEFNRYQNEFLKYFYVDFQDRNDMGMKKISVTIFYTNSISKKEDSYNISTLISRR